jgi:uncharacterized protein YjiS (DUF1127 family)
MATRGFFSRWAEYRQLVGELKRYSDLELAELGMVQAACARTAFDAGFGGAFKHLRRWLRSPGARARQMASVVVRTYRNWRRYRQTYNELMRLSERELQDVGICRIDVFSARARHGRHIPQDPATLRLDRIPIIR